MHVLAEGTAEYFNVDPDGFRAYVREHKQRALTPKVMPARDAVARFVADGDYLAYDCNYTQRGPSTLMREIIRQQKRDLWLCGKFAYVDVGLLTGGAASRKRTAASSGRASRSTARSPTGDSRCTSTATW